MGYEDRVPQQLRDTASRVNERTELWKGLTRAFEADGRDGVESELAGRMDDIQRRFDAAFARLDRML